MNSVHCKIQSRNGHACTLFLQLPPSSNPRYFFDLAMEGKRLGRVVIEVQPTVAPKMAQNFGMLVIGEKGFGYKGCQFFQVRTFQTWVRQDYEKLNQTLRCRFEVQNHQSSGHSSVITVKNPRATALFHLRGPVLAACGRPPLTCPLLNRRRGRTSLSSAATGNTTRVEEVAPPSTAARCSPPTRRVCRASGAPSE